MYRGAYRTSYAAYLLLDSDGTRRTSTGPQVIMIDTETQAHYITKWIGILCLTEVALELQERIKENLLVLSFREHQARYSYYVSSTSCSGMTPLPVDIVPIRLFLSEFVR